MPAGFRQGLVSQTTLGGQRPDIAVGASDDDTDTIVLDGPRPVDATAMAPRPTAIVAVAEALPEPVVVQETEVRRVARHDLDQMRPWLMARLQRKYPSGSEAQIFFFLCSAMGENDYWFVRNDVAIGLAVLQREPLRRPSVREHFVLSLGYPGRAEEGERDEAGLAAENRAVTLYPSLLRWGENCGAAGVRLLQWSDVSRPKLAKYLGRPVDLENYCVVRNP